MSEDNAEVDITNNGINVLLVGNPNVGKSLIFNHLTGSRQKIANFPGITLSHKSGSYKVKDTKFELHDLPGIYGFNSGNYEESVAHNYIINHSHDLIVNVADVRKLERNLFLTLQLREMQQNMILVLTFKDKWDLVEADIDTEKLSQKLGFPVILISSQEKTDIDRLRRLISQVNIKDKGKPIYPSLNLGKYQVMVDSLVNDLDSTIMIHTENILENVPDRWVVLSILMNPRASESLWPFWMVNKVQDILTDEGMNRRETSLNLISQHYEVIDGLLSMVMSDVALNHNFSPYSDKIDKILLNTKLGLPIFIFLMWLVFKITFDISAPLSDGIGSLSESLQDWIKNQITNDLIASFLADALVGGIGFILVFIPQITILFAFIGILEHTGYLARVVYIMDRFLNKIGISGTSIAPLLLGFGCNVPAIMATKSTRDRNERIALIIVNPFMSCSARLPVYIIIAGALFPDDAGLIIALMYFSGIIIAITTLYILRKTVLRGETAYLLMELPEMSFPTMRALVSKVYRQVRKFVENAASWMALGLVIMWALSITGPKGYIGPAALDDTDLLRETWIFSLGNLFQPIFGVFGWDNRLVVALIFGFIAKEIVISSFGLIYGIDGNVSSLDVIIASQFTLASGLSYLFFVLLYTPCIGTFFAIRQEIGSKWAYTSLIMGLVIAYAVALLAFFIGNLIW
ncbi:MAG: ferrous iron transport protein B [Candidatus Heimdallarchaeota archaeon]|nr:ferrous iron transport protein B [Candidatus Heimdallarchaeota archaeon]